MESNKAVIEWLLSADEPWTRYRTRLDLLDQGEDDPFVVRDREEMLRHPFVRGLISTAQSWPGYALKRHNDTKHPIQSLSVLADFGLKYSDPGMDKVVQRVLAHQSEEGAFETLMGLYKRFAGLDGEHWVWMGCDAPVLLYALTAFGCGDLREVLCARDQLAALIKENGWPCSASPKLGSFKGPGKRSDPCPLANLLALKAFSRIEGIRESDVVLPAIVMLLDHWENRGEKKFYLFGIGTDFKKLKYPLIWYDILHAADVLSHYPAALSDPRFQELVSVISDQADHQGGYTASSMYMAWKGWSFANKKEPSPWLTFLVERINKRIVAL